MARLVFGMNQSVDGYVDQMVFAPGRLEIAADVRLTS